MAETTIPKQEVLDADHVAKIKLDHTKRAYRDGSSRAGQFYYIGNYKGIGFAIEEGDYQLFKAGQVAELTLELRPYERKIDPLNPADDAPTQTRDGYRILSMITWEQLTSVEGNKAKLAEIRKGNELKIKIMERKALAEFDEKAISEDMMQKLMEAAGASGAKAAKEALSIV